MIRYSMIFLLSSSLFFSSLVFGAGFFSYNQKLSIKSENEYPNIEPFIKTGFSPQKGRTKWIAPDSPLKQRLNITGMLNSSRVETISSEYQDYSKGLWGYVDPMNPLSSLTVDADREYWEVLVKDFLNSPHYQVHLEESFDAKLFIELLMELNRLLHNNILLIASTSIKDNKDTEIVCRHYSTYMLTLFAKFMSTREFPWQATIKQISGDILNSDLKRLPGSHAWNFITITTANNEKHYWFFDPYNFVIVPIVPTSELLFHEFIYYKNQIIIRPLTSWPEYYEYVNLSLDRYILSETDENSLYHESNRQKWENLALKISQNHLKTRVNKTPQIVHEQKIKFTLKPSNKAAKKEASPHQKIKKTKKKRKYIDLQENVPWNEEEYLPPKHRRLELFKRP